jgi:hypothetical protein
MTLLTALGVAWGTQAASEEEKGVNSPKRSAKRISRGIWGNDDDWEDFLKRGEILRRRGVSEDIPQHNDVLEMEEQKQNET